MERHSYLCFEWILKKTKGRGKEIMTHKYLICCSRLKFQKDFLKNGKVIFCNKKKKFDKIKGEKKDNIF